MNPIKAKIKNQRRAQYATNYRIKGSKPDEIVMIPPSRNAN